MFHLQDNDSITTPNTCFLKELETKLNDAMTGVKNVIKNEGNMVKNCIERHGVSFYTVVKRVKSNKMSRQTSSAYRVLKNHCTSAEICTTKSDMRVKSSLKRIDPYQMIKSNIKSISNDTREQHLNSQMCTNKKVTMKNNLIKRCNISSDATAGIRSGAKRLKTVSLLKTSKMSFCDIGESSCAIVDGINGKMSSTINDKHSFEGIHNNKKHDRLTEQIKLTKSAKSKAINKVAIKESFVLKNYKKVKS